MTSRARTCLTFVFLLTLQESVQAQSASIDSEQFNFDTREHEIDNAVKVCIGDNYTTSAIANCADQEFSTWDAELNRVYRLLLNRLDANGQATLRTAQRAWIGYRDAEYKTIDSVMSEKRGTMYILVEIGKRIALTKHRVEELTSHLHTLVN